MRLSLAFYAQFLKLEYSLENAYFWRAVEDERRRFVDAYRRFALQRMDAMRQRQYLQYYEQVQSLKQQQQQQQLLPKRTSLTATSTAVSMPQPQPPLPHVPLPPLSSSILPPPPSARIVRELIAAYRALHARYCDATAEFEVRRNHRLENSNGCRLFVCDERQRLVRDRAMPLSY